MVGWVWARHPVEPAEADIIKGLANILINLIKPETAFTVSKKAGNGLLQLNKEQKWWKKGFFYDNHKEVLLW